MKKNRLKVLMISGSYPKVECGVADYTHRLCKELGRGVNLRLLTSDDRRVNPSLADGHEVLPIIKKWRALALPVIISTMRKIKPDLIHIQFPSSGYNAKTNFIILFLPFLLKSFSPGMPIVLALHDFAISKLPSLLRFFSVLLFSNMTINPYKRQYVDDH